MNASTLVQKLWNYFNVLRDDGKTPWLTATTCRRPT